MKTEALAAALLLGIVTNSSAQTTTATQTRPTKVEVLTWDLPEQMDNQPGAVVADVTGDSNRLWFVTRVAGASSSPDGVGEPAPRVYRLDLGRGKKVNKAQWSSWSLAIDSAFANGVRRIRASNDKRFVFVHTQTSIQRIDTQDCRSSLTSTVRTCTLTVWPHQANDGVVVNLAHSSDLAADDTGNVYSAIAAVDPVDSFIQKLNPNIKATSVPMPNAIRWYVGGGVGVCTSENPCLSGVAVDRRSPDLIYYSEPTGGPGGIGDGAIGEINVRTNIVRRWFFATLTAAAKDQTGAVREPRQLQFDSDGRLWVVTGSGHLVSLDPKKSLMSRHRMPAAPDGNPLGLREPFGVAPDGGLIGYTDATDLDSRVGMLMPDREVFPVPPVIDKTVRYSPVTLEVNPDVSNFKTDFISPNTATVPGQITRNEDGTWSEANTSVNFVGNVPLGIMSDQTARQGTFFFAVGDPFQELVNRVARVRLPKAELRGHDNRDDDDCDDDGKRADTDDDVDDDGILNAFDTDSDNDGIPDVTDDDDDDDGIEDSFDSKDKKERKQTSEQQVAAGEAAQAPFTINPGTLLVVASAISSAPLASVRVEIVDALGNVVAASLAAAGTSAVTFVPPAGGGDYTLRVRNQGLGTSTISTKLLTRELYSVLF